MALQTEHTTFTDDVLGRYLCSTWEEATTSPEEIDVVVLGAGMYGGYCAAKIYELSTQRLTQGGNKPLRVLVLDAGPFVVPGHTQNIPNLGFFDPGIFNPASVGSGSNPGTRNEVWGIGWRSNQAFVGQAYCVGGKGVFWGGWCPRMQAADLSNWPSETRLYLTQASNPPIATRPLTHLDLAGNPLPRGAALTGYEAIEYEIGVAPSDDFVFDPAQVAPENAALGLNRALLDFLRAAQPTLAPVTAVLPGPIAVQTQSFISGLFALDKYSSVPALTAAVRADHGDGREGDLRAAVVPNAHVIRVGFAPDGEAPERGSRVIDSIEVSVNGQRRSLRVAPHCQVVLAMGCIESTRLALESFSLVGSGLRGFGDELIGRNYMVHLRCDITFDIERARLAQWVATQPGGPTLAEELQLAALHVQCESPNGRFQYQLYAATNDAGPDSRMYQMVPDLSVQAQIAADFGSENVRLVLRASGEVQGGRGAPIGDPGFDYIDLAGDADLDAQFGHRRAWVQFNRGSHFDDAIWADIHDTGHAIARALAGGGKLTYRGNFTLGDLKRQQGVGTTFHDAGTLWMGEDPDTSVTDANGHFHHVSNAYCCDQGLFPSVGSANPVLTGLALSSRVARDIVARHADGRDGSQPRTSLLAGAGWRAAPYAGMLVLDSANDGLLETNPFGGLGLYYLPRALTNYDLSVQWKAFRTYQGRAQIANGGVLLHCPDPSTVNFSNPAEFEAFYDALAEVQIDETGKRFSATTGRSVFGDSRYKTGAVYGVSPATQWANKVASPDGASLGERYWNLYEIQVRGRDISVTLNGKRTCIATLPASKRASGFVALQFHTGRVQYRNFRLTER